MKYFVVLDFFSFQNHRKKQKKITWILVLLFIFYMIMVVFWSSSKKNGSILVDDCLHFCETFWTKQSLNLSHKFFFFFFFFEILSQNIDEQAST